MSRKMYRAASVRRHPSVGCLWERASVLPWLFCPWGSLPCSDISIATGGGKIAPFRRLHGARRKLLFTGGMRIRLPYYLTELLFLLPVSAWRHPVLGAWCDVSTHVSIKTNTQFGSLRYLRLLSPTKQWRGVSMSLPCRFIHLSFSVKLPKNRNSRT